MRRTFVVSAIFGLTVGAFCSFTVSDHFAAYAGQVGKKASQAIRILEATYGDKQGGKTCSPKLSICAGLALCEFTVDDGLCAVEAPVKNLEVTWDCGARNNKRARAAARGTKMSLSCEE